MLNNVPSSVNRMTRNIVINHPNTWECQLYRKVVDRADEPEEMGLATMGGLGVMSSENEENISWENIGIGYALQAESFMPSSMMDRQDANNGLNNEFKFLIEPEAQSGMPGYFDVRKNDVMLIVVSDDVRLAFEIVDIETVMNIPPFATRYIANRRDNLDL